ncbi:activator of 90 kDa heat shock protein ATPase homolog 1-like [Littorina saxatilis]|uniref:Activator of Hsp90 ATPase AHSA1-like N-terminal domain-containing protein n=1 Tax=Littorina saxatilis TaxID=31220 RepID=A0AAN9BEN7_9CAEN
MAKWGEGDPRWIVEERPDATNVNNWHWVEKDATNWSKNKFNELFLGLKVEEEEGWCEITELSKTEGEATANNRKGKLIFFYEWLLAGNWQGQLADGQKKFKGKFEIPNLSEENDASDIVMDVSAEKNTDEAWAVKEIMRKKGLKAVQAKVAKYIADLKEEYGQGIILPSKDSKTSAAAKSSAPKNVAKQEMNKVVQSASSKSNNIGVRIPTNTVTLKENFKCRASDLYRALTVKEMVQAYTGSDSVIEAVPGERFSLMGGNVLGEFTELVPDKKICMRWRMKSWPDEHYSNVTIELEEKEEETVLSLKQTGVPDIEVERTREGWKVNYCERIRQVFGFGARLF